MKQKNGRIMPLLLRENDGVLCHEANEERYSKLKILEERNLRFLWCFIFIKIAEIIWFKKNEQQEFGQRQWYLKL